MPSCRLNNHSPDSDQLPCAGITSLNIARLPPSVTRTGLLLWLPLPTCLLAGLHDICFHRLNQGPDKLCHQKPLLTHSSWNTSDEIWALEAALPD